MRRRGFSIVELLVVIAILLVLAALLFPVFARSKARAKLTTCQARLKQFGLALNLYRTDHDDQGFAWARTDKTGNRYPYNWFEPMASYFKSGDILWCPDPPIDPVVAYNFYHYRTWRERFPAAPDNLSVNHAFDWEPSNVLAYCANHTDGFDTRPGFAPNLRSGTYLFAREDLSLGMAQGAQMEVWWYEAGGWTQKPGRYASPVLRFPGEPWPPRA